MGRVGLATLSLLAFCGANGCRQREEGLEIHSLEGKVETIDRTSDDTGTITVLFYSEKQKQEIAGTGKVTKETEIMIDGVVARLKDIREGDRVRGEVRVDKQGEKKVQTAVKIHVERPKASGD